MAQKTAKSTVGIDHLNKTIKSIDLEALEPNFKTLFSLLMNKIEEQDKLINELRAENQQLRDEVNRLKGEQGKPSIRPQAPSKDISSEPERKNMDREMLKNGKA